jgi:HEAT repeat protein
MTDKKTGQLFPEAEKSSPKLHPKPASKKSRNKSTMENALKNIQETKDRRSRLKIIEKISNSKEPWVCEVLIQALDDPIEDIRKIIITELANREDLDLGLLYPRLFKTPWYVKTGCLHILGLRKNTSSVKYIESMVYDPNIEVRRTLANVLGEIGGKNALALLTKLSEDASSFVRAPALKALQEVSQVKFS